MKIITQSNFYDFKGQEFLFRFLIQSFLFPDTYYYWDIKNQAFVLERRNVRGFVMVNHDHHYMGKEDVMDACFVAWDILHPLMSLSGYHQMIFDYEEFQKV